MSLVREPKCAAIFSVSSVPRLARKSRTLQIEFLSKVQSLKLVADWSDLAESATPLPRATCYWRTGAPMPPPPDPNGAEMIVTDCTLVYNQLSRALIERTERSKLYEIPPPELYITGEAVRVTTTSPAVIRKKTSHPSVPLLLSPPSNCTHNPASASDNSALKFDASFSILITLQMFSSVAATAADVAGTVLGEESSIQV
ncbi:hypothetical protein Aperf_G00000086090 [Anoplocephala perfoliata]